MIANLSDTLQADLESDPVVAGRPIILQSKDGHALWVSQKILDAMDPIPDEVEGGVIARDPSGKPTGSLALLHRAVRSLTQLRRRVT